MTRQSVKGQGAKGPAPGAGKGAKEDGNGSANDEAMAAMVKANEAVLEGMVAVQREIMEFGSARLRQELETQGALAQCKDLEEAFRLQVDFAQKAMQQYSEETAKLMSLSAKISHDCWAPFEDVTRAALQQVNAR